MQMLIDAAVANRIFVNLQTCSNSARVMTESLVF